MRLEASACGSSKASMSDRPERAAVVDERGFIPDDAHVAHASQEHDMVGDANGVDHLAVELCKCIVDLERIEVLRCPGPRARARELRMALCQDADPEAPLRLDGASGARPRVKRHEH